MQPDTAWMIFQYQQHMKEALGLNDKTIDARMRHVIEFTCGLDDKPLRNISKDDIACFKARLIEVDTDVSNPGNQKAAATIVQTCQNLKAFMDWLGHQSGYRSMDRDLPNYCKPSRHHVALSKVKSDKHVPNADEIRTLLASMPKVTNQHRRDRAIVAFLFLTGVRDAALISLRLKHVDLENRLVFQDAKEVRTKFSKTMTTFWFPVGEDIGQIVTDWINERRATASSENEPVFPRSPSAIPVKSSESQFWQTAAPVRHILKQATAKTGQTYFVPHAVRSTLALMIDAIATTFEERKALSQNLGHEHMRTTEEHYG
ncbi:tyrosine-type recombinase/integrase, partial [Roseibium sediminis]|uniref:tyrosine-type recombinase/integrase n=1 Tax=Roseibium sediminis TaxID=1775174 RepID=UPI00123E2B5B